MGKTVHLNFTQKTIEKLEARSKRYAVFDERTAGLGLAVYPSGQKTFFHLKKVRGWPQRTTIEAFPAFTVEQARAKAAELNSKLATWKVGGYEGANPVARPREKSVTLETLFEHYVARHLRSNAKNPARAEDEARWSFNAYLAAWRNRPLGTIHRTDVKELHAALGGKHGQVTANRVVTFLRTLFNHALHPDIALWEGVNPAAKPRKFLFSEASRERVLTREERPRFFRALEREPHRDLRDFLLIALSTGARRGTIFAMRWDEIDFARRLWTITSPKGKRGARSHVVPLPQLAITVLKARPRAGEWIFPGARKGTHLTTVKKPWREFLKRASLSNLTLHDLRRTLATVEGDTGATAEVIQKTLGHEQASAATKIYDRSDRRDEVREAMSDAIRTLLAGGKTSQKKLLKARHD